MRGASAYTDSSLRLEGRGETVLSQQVSSVGASHHFHSLPVGAAFSVLEGPGVIPVDGRRGVLFMEHTVLHTSSQRKYRNIFLGQFDTPNL